MKNKDEDVRIVKTRDSLFKALETLMETKDIGGISIADICGTANVNRSTFYKHFESKDHFISFYLSTVMNRIADIFRSDVFSSNSDQFHIETAIWEIQKYETIIVNLLYSKKGIASTSMIYTNMVGYFLESFQDIPFAFPGENPDMVMWSQFYAGGIMTVILSWLNNDELDMRTKARMLSDFLSSLLSNIRLAHASKQLQD